MRIFTRVRSRLFLICLAATLGACSAPWYAAPPNRPTANLRVIAENSSGYYVWTRDTTSICSRDSPNFPARGGDSRPDPERVGMPGRFESRGDRFERRIQAESPFRLGISSTTGGGREIWTCNLLATFTPREGAAYEMRYLMTQGQCRVTLAEIRDAGSELARMPVELKIEPWRSGCT